MLAVVKPWRTQQHRVFECPVRRRVIREGLARQILNPGRHHARHISQPSGVRGAPRAKHRCRRVDDGSKRAIHQRHGPVQRLLAQVGVANRIEYHLVLGKRRVGIIDVRQHDEGPENLVVEQMADRNVAPAAQK